MQYYSIVSLATIEPALAVVQRPAEQAEQQAALTATAPSAAKTRGKNHLRKSWRHGQLKCPSSQMTKDTIE